MSFVKGFNMFGTDAIQISCITGNGSPTTSTVGAVGMLYMDTSSSDGDLWKCISANNDIYTWVKLINEDLLNIKNVDWNQNDSTAKDYIKNRPFYENITWNRVNENLTISDACYDGRIGLSSDDYNLFLDSYYGTVGDNLGIVKIVLDGKEYISNIRNYNNNPCVGNSAFLNDIYHYEFNDTGEDFCLLRCCVGHMTLFLADNIPTPSTVEIYLGEENLKKIDDKFLPNYGLVRSDDGLLYITINGSTIGDGIEVSSAGILYTEQELTEEQKSQARDNIGLSDTDIQDKVQSYVDEAILGGAW